MRPDAILVLRAHVGEHLVALGGGDQRAENDGYKPWEARGAATELTRRSFPAHYSTL